MLSSDYYIVQRLESLNQGHKINRHTLAFSGGSVFAVGWITVKRIQEIDTFTIMLMQLVCHTYSLGLAGFEIPEAITHEQCARLVLFRERNTFVMQFTGVCVCANSDSLNSIGNNHLHTRARDSNTHTHTN